MRRHRSQALQNYRNELSNGWKEGEYTCSTAVQKAFGAPNPREYCRTGFESIFELQALGYTVRRINTFVMNPVDGVYRHLTLGQFMKHYPTGKYFIRSTRHAMAWIHGELTDTQLNGTTSRRIWDAYEVIGDPMNLWPCDRPASDDPNTGNRGDCANCGQVH